MFIGHFAPAFVIATGPRSAPLWALLLCTAWLDLVFGFDCIVGLEVAVVGDPPIFANLDLQEAGWSHSMLAALLWSGAAALFGRRLWGSWTAAMTSGVSVFSHWILDVLSHRPDMPIIGFGSAMDWKLGTGLAAWPLAFFAVESAVTIAAVSYFAPGHRRLLRTTGILLLLWSNQVFGFFLPAPPSVTEAGVLTIVAFLIAWVAFVWAAPGSPLRRSRRSPGQEGGV